MSDGKALENLKKDTGALAAAYRDAGGKGGDGHHHNHCPFCNSDDAFMLGQGQNGNAVFACYKAGCSANAKPDKKVHGTIVDLLMLARKIDSKAACKLALEKYSNAAADGRQKAEGGTQPGNAGAREVAKPVPVRSKGKLHLTVDDAIGAARFMITSKKKNGGPMYSDVVLFKTWRYTDSRGAPVLVTARFNTIKTEGGELGKEFVPVHQDGNGWRVGLGPWGKPEQRCPLYGLLDVTKALKAAGRI